jgi:hypothetical protein
MVGTLTLSAQRLREVPDQIIAVLDAHRDAHE